MKKSICFFLCFLNLSLHLLAQNSVVQERPNIILFTADQLIPMMTGPYGDDIAITPNLDKLAEEGVTFENAYSTCPVCVPARYSLLSGMYLATSGAYDNGSMLRSGIPTHNDYLNLAGYETTLSGKAHFIGPDQLHGFTRRLMTDIYPTEMKFMPQRTPQSNFKDLHPKPIAIDYIGENVGPTQEDMELDYDERAIFHAIRYLSEKRTKPGYSAQEEPPKPGKVPFFLHVSINKPHEPFFAYQRHWDLYENADIPIPQYPDNLEEMYTSMDKALNTLHGVDRVDLKNPESLRKVHRAYYACVSYVDEKLGEVIAALDQFGLRDNTILIFLSDHGDMLGHRGMVQKRVFYEHSSRIPLIFNFPKNFPTGEKGRRNTDPVSIVDVMPTMLELAGITDLLPVDGRSLLPQIKGETDEDRYVFCENYSEGVLTPCVMVRQGDYKYTYIREGEDGNPKPQWFKWEVNQLGWKNWQANKTYGKLKED